MGYSLTCFATTQSISLNDECVFLPILRQTTFSPISMTYEDQKVEQWGTTHSSCHPVAFWDPVGSFMRGTYDGYGRIEPSDDDVTNKRLYRFITRMFQGAPVVEQGENSSTEKAFDLQSYVLEQTPALHAHIRGGRASDRSPAAIRALLPELHKVWQHVWDFTERSRVFYPNYLRQLQPVQFAVMHTRAYDNLLEAGTAIRPCLRESIPLEKLAAMASEDFPERAKDTSILRDFYFGNSFRDKLRSVGNFGGTSYPEEADETSEACLQYGNNEISFEAFVEAVRPALEVRYVLSGLDVLNIRLQPVATGSEDPWNDIGRRFAKFIRTTSAQVSQDRRDLMNN